MPHRETIDTYDQHASQFAAQYAGAIIDPYIISEGLRLAGNPSDPRIVEVGCGDGRSATEIVRHAGWYEGFDPAQGFIDLARQRQLPGASFTVADAVSYDYPAGLDIVYGFWSFPHLPMEEFQTACRKIHAALRLGGVLALTLREGLEYEKVSIQDQFGNRTFYHYSEAAATTCAGPGFEANKLGSLRPKSTGQRLLLLAFRKSDDI